MAPRAHGATVVPLDWRPPAGGDRELGLVLARIEDDLDDPIGARVAAANRRAVERLLAARPVLVDVQPAALAVPGLGARTILHAGPPIAWARMCGPMRGAVIGAVLYEGWAATSEAAERLARDGSVDFDPLSPSGRGRAHGGDPLAVDAGGRRRQSDGRKPRLRDAERRAREGAALRRLWGDVLDRLRWMAGTLAPALARALAAHGPVDLRSLTAQALLMGDECHNRNVAATSLFSRLLAPRWCGRRRPRRRPRCSTSSAPMTTSS